MATKRRTVWFNDEQWSAMQRTAAEAGVNISQLIWYNLGLDTPAMFRKVLASEPRLITVDDVQPSVRPFTPAPKPRRK